MNVADFILARLAEDEAMARAAAAGSRGRWRITPSASGRPTLHTEGMGWEPLANEGIWQCDDPDDDCEEYRAQDERDAEHIARQDPARVLRQVEAMRRVVDLRYSWNLEAEREPNPPFGPILRAQVITADSILRALAAIWSDHADYREEWRA